MKAARCCNSILLGRTEDRANLSRLRSGNDLGGSDILPLVTRHLDPLAAFEFRHLVYLGLVDGHGPVLVADPKVDVVDLILGADDAKVGAGKVMAVIELPHRL